MDRKDIITALVDSYFDPNQEVSQASFNSLLTFGSKESNTVLLCCLTKFNDPKFNMRQLNEIFKCIKLLEKITQELNTELDKTIHTSLVLFSINILRRLYDSGLMKDSDLEEQCETLISNILTNVGKKNVDEVTNELLKQFNLTENTMSNEHLFVIKTLGNMCTINPIGIRKFVKTFLQLLWPSVKSSKSDYQRLVLSHTIGCIASAILENMANNNGCELTESNDIEADNYEEDFDSLLDVFITWVQTRDNRTKEQIIKAIGFILALISKKKFISNQSKLLEILLSFYRKTINVPSFSSDLDSFYITQSLTQYLNVCHQYDCGVMGSKLEPQAEIELDMIMNILFRQSLIPVNSTHLNSINNSNEILRTFSILSIKNCSRVVNFILKKFGENSIIVKISGLTILKHLIDTRTNEITEKFSSIFFALRLLVDEDNNRLKKMLIQVIVSIAYKGYLNLEGGKFLIQFILKQCAKQDNNNSERSSRRQSDASTFNSINQDQNQVTNSTLKQMAENVLPLFVNTVENIEDILWPTLFEYLVLPEYIGATGIICNALYKMGDKLKSKDDPNFNIDFTKVVHLPKREEIMARLVVLIGDDPLKSNENIKSCLKLMKIISTLIHPNLTTLWQTITNQYLDILKLDEQLTKDDWQHKALALVNQSFIEIDDEEFITKFGKHLLDHLHFYNNSIDLKYFLILVLANLVRRLNKKKYSEKIMDEVFTKIDHNNEQEREACALLFGHCAAQFLDSVIVKLEHFFNEAQKNYGILSSILSLSLRSDRRNDAEKIKSTIILAYGYVTKFAPTSLLITRIETPILNCIENYYKDCKDNLLVQDAFVKCVRILAISMRPENLNMIYMLKGRKRLIYEMINIAKQENTSESIKFDAIEALGLLLVLDPVLNNTEKSTLIENIAKIIFKSPNDEQLLRAFQFLIKNLIAKESKNTQNLSILFEIISPYALSLKDEEERLNVMRTIELTLDEFNTNIVAGDFVKLESYCYLCSLILPYCCDELETVRKVGLQCLHKLASISVRLQSKKVEEDELIGRLANLVNHSESNIDYLTNELAKCMAVKLRLDNIQPANLIIKLISSLNHYKGVQKTYGTAKIALGLTKHFISELRNDVQKLIDTVYQTRLDYAKTNSVLIETLAEIASSHLNLFCNHLVSFPLPFDDHVARFWRSLSESITLSKHLIGWCIDRLNEDNLVFYKGTKGSNAIARSQSLAIVCGLGEMFKNQELYDIVHNNSDKLFVSFLLTISSYINVDYLQDNSRKALEQEFVNLPFNSSAADEVVSSMSSVSNVSNVSHLSNLSSATNISNITNKSNSSNTSIENIDANEIKKYKPIRSAILTMKQYCNLLKYDRMLLTLESEGCFKLMEDSNTFYSSICILAKSIYLYQPSLISSLVNPLTLSLNHKFVERRLVSLAFFSFLLSLNDFPDKEMLFEPFLNTILNLSNDPSPIVRLYCVKGLGTIEQLNDVSCHKFVLPIVSALVNSLDDSDDSNDRIKHEALNSLCLVLSKIDLKLILNLVTNLVLRLKSFFNRDKFYIREKAVEAVGHLMKNGDLKEILFEESSNLIIHLLITLNDSTIDVVKSTKFTLINVSKVLEIQSLSNLINKYLVDKNTLHYTEFIYQLTKLMVLEFNDQLENFVNILIVYLKLDNARVQCNSIQILGALFNNDTKNEITSDLKQRTVLLIIHFLKDSKNLELRIKAAEILTNF